MISKSNIKLFNELEPSLWTDIDESEQYICENSFIDDVKFIYQKYIDIDLDSTGSIKEELLHDLIRNRLKKNLPSDRYEIISKTNYQDKCYGEFEATYIYNSKKKIDICIIDKKRYRPVAFINCKYPLCSVGKNHNNFVEQITGECYHIHKCNKDVPLFIFNMCMRKTPILKTDEVTKEKYILKFDDNISEISRWESVTKELLDDKFVNGVCYCMFDDELYINLRKIVQTCTGGLHKIGSGRDKAASFV